MCCIDLFVMVSGQTGVLKITVLVMYLFLLQQTKRKLDDANKRLEFLYDKLREQTVSSVLLPPCPLQILQVKNFMGGVGSYAIHSRCLFFLWKHASDPFIVCFHAFP